MTALDTVRITITLTNAALIAFNGLFRAILGMTNPLVALPFIVLATALLVGALLAEEREQLPLFWLFSAAGLVVGFGL